MYEFGPYQLDPITIRLSKNNQGIEIEPQVFNTLLLLLENRERVVTKDELLKKIWHGRVVTDHVITRIIYELRKNLDDKDNPDSCIRTVRGKGYQFIAEVFVSESPDNDSIKPSISIKQASKKTPYNIFVWIFLFVLLIPTIFLLTRSPTHQTITTKTANVVSKQNVYPILTVLPIKVENSSIELLILVQSLIDYLTNQLTLNLKMKVIHPDSLVSLAGQIDDVRAIQQSTRSDFIVQGFVESLTEQSIKLHLTLYKSNSNGDLVPFSLGAFEFPYPKNTKDLNDLYKQRKVTVRNIVKIIKPSIKVNDDGNFETADPEAYRLVIAAHNMSRSDDCKEMQRAEQLLLKAVERDTQFVYAYLQLFSNYYKQVWICGESADYYQKGLAMAEIIDQLAPNKYQAVAIRRSTILVESNQVEKAYEFSKNADWNSTEALYDKTYSLRYAGFLNAASLNLDRILQLDPFFFIDIPIQQAPNTLLYLNQFKAHLSLLAEPGNSYHDYFRGLNLFLTGELKQASKVLNGVVDRTPVDLFGKFSQALLHVIDGDDAKAIQAIDSIVTLRKEKNHTDGEMTYKVAQLYALAKADEFALKNLQIAVDQGFFPMNYFLVDPALKSIRNSRQFAEIIVQATQRHESFAKRFNLVSETLADTKLVQN